MPPSTPTLDLDRWRAAGLDLLTGPEQGPGLGPPRGFVARLDALTDRIRSTSAAIGDEVDIDGLRTLAVRAEMLGLGRRGRISCGGSCHLVEAADGWFAVSLSRPDDWDLLPAWIGLRPGGTDRWPEVHEGCRHLERDLVVAQGAALGLPIGALSVHRSETTRPRPLGPTSREPRRLETIRVADLSSMWAGPLCGSVLAAAGAEVIKVESSNRPDGTRLGPPAFYELLNGMKTEVSVDLDSVGGVRDLEALLRSVDVVIESSRPRALRQLGIDADQLLAASEGPDLWISITGHGRDGDAAQRVAFGDDAAVSGGLVVWSDDGPSFCGDAIADPLTGLSAAAAALDALRDRRRGLLDVAMSGVAADFAGTDDGAHR